MTSWRCKACKIATGIIIGAILSWLLYQLMSGAALTNLVLRLGVPATSFNTEAGAYAAWVGFIKWIGQMIGLEDNEGWKTLGYALFSVIAALTAGAIYKLADWVDWILCKICSFLGACDDCKMP